MDDGPGGITDSSRESKTPVGGPQKPAPQRGAGNCKLNDPEPEKGIADAAWERIPDGSQTVACGRRPPVAGLQMSAPQRGAGACTLNAHDPETGIAEAAWTMIPEGSQTVAGGRRPRVGGPQRPAPQRGARTSNNASRRST